MSVHEIIQSLLQAKLELKDDVLLEQFWFRDGGSVVATLCTKDGAVCGPILKYSIGEDDSVLIGNQGESLSYRWERLEPCGEELVVSCRGTVKRFSITRPPKKERWLP